MHIFIWISVTYHICLKNKYKDVKTTARRHNKIEHKENTSKRLQKINQCIAKQSKPHTIHKALHIGNDFCITMLLFFFLALKDPEERVRHGDFLVRLLEYILHMYTKCIQNGWNGIITTVCAAALLY